jgi:hypothetical protein
MKHRNEEIKFTRRGKWVFGLMLLAFLLYLSTVPALWWTDSPIPLH